ncbi:lipid-A-disaccharide synthase [Plasticicumulans acidivorans]|uniref:Lipid-A-disaccharide synthase n=1 Tax=Plasticicumulans acidivorans TaxID=886464 RepID=A0A317MXH3_9GAMM|nr:lipid-A-disaccharide synthase [Plasticicumulans acidivorans]PWV63511.1 lipid-A-disaccharide synthase [Plasticicumulans acidivorans]
MRIAIVAGELSGDVLGGGLIEALRRRYPQATFEGIGGPRMIGAGLKSLYPLDALSVMGLVEVLRHLPRLLGIRGDLLRRWRAKPPDLFVGIDAPDFNLPLARRLRAAGIRTAHYVSPSVWAWRQGRVKGISKSIDLMLTLFPFEAAFYQQHRVPVACVGHPLADEIPAGIDMLAAREAIGLADDIRWLALLPGSRAGEVARHVDVFLEAFRLFHAQQPDFCAVIPCATPKLHEQIESRVAAAGLCDYVLLLDGRARDALAASELALVASGTATLEAMLVGRPLVMAYIVAPLTYRIAKRLMRIDRFSLPNLLAGRDLIPEFIQQAATPAALATALEDWLAQPQRMTEVCSEFARLHAELRRNASEAAAQALGTLLAD